MVKAAWEGPSEKMLVYMGSWKHSYQERELYTQIQSSSELQDSKPTLNIKTCGRKYFEISFCSCAPKPFSTQFIKYIILLLIAYQRVKDGDPVVTFPECVVLTTLDHIAYYHTVEILVALSSSVWLTFHDLYFSVYEEKLQPYKMEFLKAFTISSYFEITKT